MKKPISIDHTAAHGRVFGGRLGSTLVVWASVIVVLVIAVYHLTTAAIDLGKPGFTELGVVVTVSAGEFKRCQTRAMSELVVV